MKSVLALLVGYSSLLFFLVSIIFWFFLVSALLIYYLLFLIARKNELSLQKELKLHYKLYKRKPYYFFPIWSLLLLLSLALLIFLFRWSVLKKAWSLENLERYGFLTLKALPHCQKEIIALISTLLIVSILVGFLFYRNQQSFRKIQEPSRLDKKNFFGMNLSLLVFWEVLLALSLCLADNSLRKGKLLPLLLYFFNPLFIFCFILALSLLIVFYLWFLKQKTLSTKTYWLYWIGKALLGSGFFLPIIIPLSISFEKSSVDLALWGLFAIILVVIIGIMFFSQNKQKNKR